MPNYSKATLTRIGRMLNSGESTDPAPLAKLVKAGALGRKAIYNWSLPETDPQHRKMPRLAKRMVAMLAYFAAAGLMNDKRLEEIVALEAMFEDETQTAAALRRMKAVVGGGGKGKGKKAAAAAGQAAEHEDEEDDEMDAPGEAHAGGEHPHPASAAA